MDISLSGHTDDKQSPESEYTLDTSNIGNTLLDFFKKPIEWIIPSSSSNKSMHKTDNSNLFQSNNLSNNSRKSLYYQNVTRKENESRSSKDENIISSELLSLPWYLSSPSKLEVSKNCHFHIFLLYNLVLSIIFQGSLFKLIQYRGTRGRGREETEFLRQTQGETTRQK